MSSLSILRRRGYISATPLVLPPMSCAGVGDHTTLVQSPSVAGPVLGHAPFNGLECTLPPASTSPQTSPNHILVTRQSLVHVPPPTPHPTSPPSLKHCTACPYHQCSSCSLTVYIVVIQPFNAFIVTPISRFIPLQRHHHPKSTVYILQ